MQLAIIPARGGSKRIPRKNLVPFAGRPLIAHPLATARASELFGQIHVSTDDPGIAAVAAAEGHAPEFSRPAELADDHATIMQVLRWVLLEYQRRGSAYDTVALIYATAALITADDLRRANGIFVESGARHPVMAVAEYAPPVQWAMREDDKGLLQFVDFAATQVRSQDVPPAYFDAAAFSFFSPRHILDEPAEGLTFRPYHLPRRRAVDIDTAEDLELAELLFLRDTKG